MIKNIELSLDDAISNQNETLKITMIKKIYKNTAFIVMVFLFEEKKLEIKLEQGVLSSELNSVKNDLKNREICDLKVLINQDSAYEGLYDEHKEYIKSKIAEYINSNYFLKVKNISNEFFEKFGDDFDYNYIQSLMQFFILLEKSYLDFTFYTDFDAPSIYFYRVDEIFYMCILLEKNQDLSLIYKIKEIGIRDFYKNLFLFV